MLFFSTGNRTSHYCDTVKKKTKIKKKQWVNMQESRLIYENS